MHPAIKIVSLVILTIFTTQGSWLTLLISSLFLLPYYLTHSHLWHGAIKMLLRLKWFFLSIFVIYYYYTPQNISVDQHAYDSLLLTFSLMMENSMAGLLRIAILVIILFSVNLFIKTSTKEEILSALLWLSSPLTFIHINVERISLRAVLTLDYLETLSLRLSLYKNNRIAIQYPVSHYSFINAIKQKRQSLLHLIEHSGIILHDILKEADNTSGKSYTIECLNAPSIAQTIFPLLLGFSLYLTL